MTEQALSFETTAGQLARPSGLDRWARSRVRARLASLRSGSITLVDGGERRSVGDASSDLHATVYVLDPRFYRKLAAGGALGGAESYIEGYWRSDDLPALIRILALNADTLGSLDRRASLWRRGAAGILHALRRNTRSGSRRNIAAHYDLGNRFFELFLDPTLTYSSGIFEHPEATMEEASIAKYDRVCRKLRIGRNDHVLEIGTGWGGFALHAASVYGCRVSTTTISRQQYEKAVLRVEDAGLSERIEVLFEDYRDLRGCYDKLVSIEMIEAVGHQHLGGFFRSCGALLKPEGLMLLQAITVPDQEFEAHIRNVDFIKRYIFPGGELVSVGAMNSAASQASDLRLVHLEDLTPHYAETLRRWRRRMSVNLPQIRALGLDDRFLRMWEFYLCYCEGGFDERAIGLAQAVFEKPGSRRDSLLGRLAIREEA